jgi:hypothetical protein
MVFGTTKSFDGGVSGNPSLNEHRPTIWVFKIDSVGNLLWQQCIGGIADERVYSGVIQKSDHDYVVAGTMNLSPSFDVDCPNHENNGMDAYWIFELSDTTVSVVETTPEEPRVNVYPNPASNLVTFELSGKNPSVRAIELTITDIFGQPLEKVTLSSNRETANRKWVWDVRSLPQGVYLYTIIAGGQGKTGKIIISR